MKSVQRNKARELRSQGWATGKIAKELGVSKSSVSLWVRDILLTKEQIEILKSQNAIYDKQHKGAKIKSDMARTTRLRFQQEGKEKAREGNLLHQAGCMLYWAEGTKSKTTCKFTNSDAEMVKLFVKFLRECLNVPNEKIMVRINCYTNNGLTKEEIEKFWLNNLQLPEINLRKGQENIRPRSITNANRHHKLIYGICCIEIYSVAIVQHIYGAIQEYASFNNNYMLM
jgi:predicted transcriptional regulator